MSKGDTIFETIVKANGVLSSKRNINIIVQVNAKKQLDIATKLLLKGYPLDQEIRPLMAKYQNTNKVPDAKDYYGKEITAERMTQLMEEIYPRVPHSHAVLLIVQKFGSEDCNFISNTERGETVDILRSLAKQIENKKEIIKPKSN